MKILVLGTGFVAGAYMRALWHLGYLPVAMSRAWVNYLDADQLRFALSAYQPDFVINAAGYTGESVDDCQDPDNKDECYHANVVLPRTVAELCKQHSTKLIHISSGCIFNGPGPFSEETTPNFIGGWYQQCKWSAEKDILASGARAWIFRIRMPFNNLVHPRNWLVRLCAHELILDGLNSVTGLEEFAMRSWQLAGKADPGIYHAAYNTPVSTAKVAQMLFEAGIRYSPVKLWDPAKFAESHTLRSSAVLDSSKFEKAYGAEFGDPLCGIRWAISKDYWGVSIPPRA